MRPGRRWSVASTSKKPPGVEGGQHFSDFRIRFGYSACCPPAHQPLPTGSEISTRPIKLDRLATEAILESFISTRRAHSRSVDSTALLRVMSTFLVIRASSFRRAGAARDDQRRADPVRCAAGCATAPAVHPGSPGQTRIGTAISPRSTATHQAATAGARSARDRHGPRVPLAAHTWSILADRRPREPRHPE